MPFLVFLFLFLFLQTNEETYALGMLFSALLLGSQVCEDWRVHVQDEQMQAIAEWMVCALSVRDVSRKVCAVLMVGVPFVLHHSRLE